MIIQLNLDVAQTVFYTPKHSPGHPYCLHRSALVGPASLECSSWSKPTNLQMNLPQKQYTIQQCQPALDDVPCERLSEIKGNPVNRNRHALVLTSLTSLWEHASVVFTLPVLPGVQASMTCLCLETSLPMQRSHWHLMSRHFCLRLVSRNSTATAISMHMHCSFTKPRRTLRRGYSKKKKLKKIHLAKIHAFI